jgi:hypothetical protein
MPFHNLGKQIHYSERTGWEPQWLTWYHNYRKKNCWMHLLYRKCGRQFRHLEQDNLEKQEKIQVAKLVEQAQKPIVPPAMSLRIDRRMWHRAGPSFRMWDK